MTWSWWRRRAELDRQLEAELQDHLDRLTRDYVLAGVPEPEARRRARIEFGSVEPIKEASRDTRPLRWVDDVGHDLRHAARSLTRTPGFTCVALLTLALGIGANTAMFSVVNAVLLQRLPFPDADSLVNIFEIYTGPLGGTLRQPLPVEDLRGLRSTSRTLSDVDTYGSLVELRLGRDEDVDLRGARVSRSTLSTLGARVVLGRLYDGDESASMAPVLVLSEATWRRHFGADPDVIGRPIIVEGSFPPPFGEPRAVFTVVGVMAAGFPFPDEGTSFWIPLNMNRAGGRGAIARLRDGISPEVATAEVTNMFGTDRPASRFEVVRLQDEHGASIRSALTVLMVAVGLVLLIACANLTNLLLARTMSRGRELAVRSALGAGRGRLVRQLLTEGFLLAYLGGVAGVVFAYGAIEALRQLLSGLSSRPDLTQLGRDFGGPVALPLLEPALDATTLAYTAVLCLLATALSSTAPALMSPRPGYIDGLREATTSALASFGLFRRNVHRSVLVIGQVSLAVALLVAGALVMHGFVRLLATDTGYAPESVLTFNVRLAPARSSVTDVAVFAETFVSRLERVPGVLAAGYTFALPTVSSRMQTSLRLSPSEELPRQPPGPSSTLQNPSLLVVSPRYPKAIGLRLIAGRHLDDYERAGGRRGVLINETLARGRFPGANTVGHSVYIRGDEPHEVVGVVPDIWQQLDQAPGPQVITPFPALTDPFLQALGTRYYYAVRTSGASASVLPAVRDTLNRLGGEALLDNVASLDQLLASSIARPRMYAILLGLFAAIAVVLSAIGIYGVMAYAVAQSTREIGLRMALGAERREVLALVLSRAGVLTAVGLLAGLASAVALSRYLQSMLFGVAPLDASTYAAVTAIFASVALMASYVPAYRATKVDPLIALRSD